MNSSSASAVSTNCPQLSTSSRAVVAAEADMRLVKLRWEEALVRDETEGVLLPVETFEVRGELSSTPTRASHWESGLLLRCCDEAELTLDIRAPLKAAAWLPLRLKREALRLRIRGMVYR
jgi:hypothetical protein